MGGNANNLYTSTGNPPAGGLGRSAQLRDEFDLIETGFDKVIRSHFQIYFEDANTAATRAVPTFNSRVGQITRLSLMNLIANTTTKTVFTANIGGASITHPAWEVAITAAAYTIVSVVPTNNNDLSTAVQSIRVVSDGGGSPTMPVMVTIEVTWT